MSKEIDDLTAALMPLVNIANAYDSNELDDEARKFWGINSEHKNERAPEAIELYSGRGGKRLLTLADCLNARLALQNFNVNYHRQPELKEVLLWAVVTNDDLTEGRGRQYVAHYCELESTANRLAKRNYVQGTNCPVRQEQVYLIGDKVVAPMNAVNVVKPTAEDKRVEELHQEKQAVVEKAKAAGLTDHDIALLRRT